MPNNALLNDAQPSPDFVGTLDLTGAENGL